MEDGSTLLCDPWMSRHGAFYASWFPFPANDHVRLPPAVDAIYLSHAHEDHFDPETFTRFARDTRVLIADFTDPVLREGLSALGFTNVVTVPDGAPVRVGRLTVQIFRDEDSRIFHDSAVLVRSPTATVLNLNDCRLSEAYETRIGGIDVLLGQSSGANWYPLTYEYPEHHARALAAAKRRRSLERLTAAAARLNPAVTVPCAGPPCFLDPALFHYNDIGNEADNPFPMMDTAVEFLEQHGRRAFLTMPGDIIEAAAGALRLKTRSLRPEEVYGRRREYLGEYAARKVPVISRCLHGLQADPSTGARLRQELARVLTDSKVFVPEIRGLIRFQLRGVADGDIVMDCREGRPAEVRRYAGERVNYRFSLDHRLVADLLKQPFVNFENVFYSMRFSVSREPDLYNNALFALLFNFDAARLRLAEQGIAGARQTPPEVYEVTDEGTRFLVQRRCPHMGADLRAVGHVRGGMLTCLRHGWQFRLADGKCVNVTAPPLFVERLPPADRQEECS